MRRERKRELINIIIIIITIIIVKLSSSSTSFNPRHHNHYRPRCCLCRQFRCDISLVNFEKSRLNKIKWRLITVFLATPAHVSLCRQKLSLQWLKCKKNPKKPTFACFTIHTHKQTHTHAHTKHTRRGCAPIVLMTTSMTSDVTKLPFHWPISDVICK